MYWWSFLRCIDEASSKCLQQASPKCGEQVSSLYKGMNEDESNTPIHNISSLHLFSLYVLHCLANSIYPTTRYHARLLKEGRTRRKNDEHLQKQRRNLHQNWRREKKIVEVFSCSSSQNLKKSKEKSLKLFPFENFHQIRRSNPKLNTSQFFFLTRGTLKYFRCISQVSYDF